MWIISINLLKLLELFYILFFHKVLKILCLFSTHSASQFGLLTYTSSVGWSHVGNGSCSDMWLKWFTCTMTYANELAHAVRLVLFSSSLHPLMFSANYIWNCQGFRPSSSESLIGGKRKKQARISSIYSSTSLCLSSFPFITCPHGLPFMYPDLYYCITELFMFFSVLSLNTQ